MLTLKRFNWDAARTWTLYYSLYVSYDVSIYARGSMDSEFNEFLGKCAATGNGFGMRDMCWNFANPPSLREAVGLAEGIISEREGFFVWYESDVKY